jgi:alkylation response protein AidB-like acyl-CoA dehydrogenase
MRARAPATSLPVGGIDHWHAHEGRHTAVSIMSSNGVRIQEISDTMGHKSTHVTETVYRHVIVPAIRGGATVMGDSFNDALACRHTRLCNARPLGRWVFRAAVGDRGAQVDVAGCAWREMRLVPWCVR